MELNHATLVLDELAKLYGNGRQAQIARKLDLKPQTLAGWRDRDSLDYQRVYSTFPDINPHWLLTHTGPMLKDAEDGASGSLNESTVTYSRPTPPAGDAVEALKKVVALLEKDNARMQAELDALKSTSRALGTGLVPELSGRKKQLSAV